MAKYYIIHPNGRSKLKATTDEEAVAAFNEHYALTARWACPKPVAKLVKQEDVVMGTVDLIPSGFAPAMDDPKLVL
jgi:hypothetical protein